MAKWGEGDPRWIVEEREDAVNVNNWHWREKDATEWSKNYIRDLFSGIEWSNENYKVRISEVSKIDGYAMINVRKAKLIFLWDWALELHWEARRNPTTGGNSESAAILPHPLIKGDLQVVNLSDENEADELEAEIHVTDEKQRDTDEEKKDGDNNTVASSSSSSKVAVSKRKDALKQISWEVKEAVRLKMWPELVRSRIGQYIRDLKSDHSKGLVLPTNTASATNTTKTTTNATTGTENTMKQRMRREEEQKRDGQSDSATANANGSAPSSSVAAGETLTMDEEFFCSAADLYQVFTTEQLCQAFSRTSATVEPRVGGRIHMFGSTVSGEFVEMEAPKLLRMKWRHSSWQPDSLHSDLSLTFVQSDSGTRLTLTQSGIPANRLEQMRNGWRENYFSAIKTAFGYGGRMF